MSIATGQITGLLLAGGRGTRMGGVDKGLQLFQGMALAQHALQRLAPQVGGVMINANRNLQAYQVLAPGVPVWPDPLPDHPGPLAGFLAGLAHCPTEWLVTVPCDTPNFPEDLVVRLADAAQDQQADIAMAASLEDGVVQAQPVFCLLRASLQASLRDYLQSGRRKIDHWTAQQRCATVLFDRPGEAQAFFNANTLDDLRGPG